VRIRRVSSTEAPEINYIPLIDVLLVIVIFLVCTTTFIRQSQLKVELPGTQSSKQQMQQDKPLIIRIGKDGNYTMPDQGILDQAKLRLAIRQTMKSTGNNPEQRAVLEADAEATHQSVVTAMDILAAEGVARVSIATASKAH
jgi:biopolymer transport protein ExbD